MPIYAYILAAVVFAVLVVAGWMNARTIADHDAVMDAYESAREAARKEGVNARVYGA